MISMTGYGSSTVATDDFRLEVVLKSYNNRYLDIEYAMPPVFSPYEAEIGAKIGEVARRGHLDVSVRLKTLKSDVKLTVDTLAVKRYTEAFGKIAEAAGRPLKPALADYLSQPGILVSEDVEDEELDDAYHKALLEAMDEALAQLKESKEREGKATHDDLLRLGNQIKEGLGRIAMHADELEALVKTNLETRIQQMLGDQNYDRNRILEEVAVMLNRYTVNEEIRRLETHLKAYDGMLASSEPVGKRLDFLCQEMNREINTIGSKSQIVEMNLEVVKMKDGLENIREQIRNIE